MALVDGAFEVAEDAGEAGVMEDEGGAGGGVDFLVFAIDGVGLLEDLGIDGGSEEAVGSEATPGVGGGEFGHEEFDGGFRAEFVLDGLAEGLESDGVLV